MKKTINTVILIIAVASSAVNSFAGEQKPDFKKTDFTPNDSAKKTSVDSRRTSRENKKAKDLLQASIQAMGGENRLRALKSLKIKFNGHTNLLEQSERPEGPWIVTYEEITHLRDLENKKFRETSRSFRSANNLETTLIEADGIAIKTTSFNGRTSPPRPALADLEWYGFSPERILLNALDAAEVSAEDKPAMLQGIPQNVVSFEWQKTPVRLFLNSYTNLPTAVEYVRAYPFAVGFLNNGHWSPWGDVTTRVYLSDWTLEAGGIRYPHQWNVERNNQPYKTLTVAELAINAALPPDSFDIPENIRAAYEKRKDVKFDEYSTSQLGRPDKPAQEIKPGIVFVPGSFNVTLIKQTDGIVIIEAPISSGYSAKAIAEAEKRFPKMPIKAVISTSDAFPHIGGIREYVAHNIPLYALDLNRLLLERLIAAPRKNFPDALALKAQKPKFKVVSGKTIVGEGANRMELFPVRGEGGERMLMVYFPEHKLLYGGDLIQGARPDGTFILPQYLAELADAASREKLPVETVYAMHTDPLPWTRLTDFVEKAKAEAK